MRGRKHEIERPAYGPLDPGCIHGRCVRVGDGATREYAGHGQRDRVVAGLEGREMTLVGYDTVLSAGSYTHSCPWFLNCSSEQINRGVCK
jgi:hypothetical protein